MTLLLGESRDSVMKSKMKELEGSMLGDCALIKELGAGGMGSVFQAEHTSLKMKVAVKVLSPHFSDDKEFITRFYREARHTARLEHPNIVRIFGVHEDKGFHFIVMAYIDGASLEDLLSKTTLSEKNAITYMLQTLAGLDYAHNEDIIHRDIKPGNLMLTSKGEIKITDFGLVRHIQKSRELTQEGTTLGTPSFMSPEQWENVEVDNRTDIFAVGVTLYTLLTKAYPYEGESTVLIYRNAAEGNIVPLSHRIPDVSEELEEIIHNVLTPDRNQRFSTSHLFASKLKSYLLRISPDRKKFLPLFPPEILRPLPDPKTKKTVRTSKRQKSTRIKKGSHGKPRIPSSSKVQRKGRLKSTEKNLRPRSEIRDSQSRIHADTPKKSIPHTPGDYKTKRKETEELEVPRKPATPGTSLKTSETMAKRGRSRLEFQKNQNRTGLMIGVILALCVLVVIIIIMSNPAKEEIPKEDKAKAAYNKANSGDLEDWKKFVKEFPDSDYVFEIQKKIKKAEKAIKEEEDAYNRALVGTIKDCDDYLNRYPVGKHCEDVIKFKKQKIKHAKDLLKQKEDEFFRRAMEGGIKECNEYMAKFSNGEYYDKVLKRKIELQRKKPPSDSLESILSGGVISKNLTIKEGEYFFKGRVTIQSDAVLTIEAGVKLRFAENTGIVCYGTIAAEGNTDKRIIFSARNIKGWEGIVFIGYDSSVSSFEHCNFIEGSGTRFVKSDDIFSLKSKPEEIKNRCGGVIALSDRANVQFFDVNFDKNKADFGGAVLCANSSPKFKNCTFSNNESTSNKYSEGGAVAIYIRSTPEFSDCTFKKNVSLQGGGILAQRSTPKINSCTFEENRCSPIISRSKYYGGAVFVSSSEVEINDCVFTKNTSSYAGGGICASKSDITVESTEFTGNSAINTDRSVGFGGALNCLDCVNVKMNNCYFSENKSVFAGAVYMQSPGVRNRIQFKISGCEFKDNLAYSAGGAIACIRVEFILENCCIEKNTSSRFGGGIYLSTDAKLSLINCEIKENNAKTGGGICLLSNGEFTKDGKTTISENKGGNVKKAE